MTPDDDRRAVILAATRTAMNQFGVRRMTVADVAEQAGLSRQTIYEYFPSRDLLIEGAMEAAGRQLVATALAEAEGTADPAAELVGLLTTVLRYFSTSPLWSVEAKRKEFVPHVVGGGPFAVAAVRTMRDRLTELWPDAEARILHRAADTLVRTLIGHGLAPEHTAPSAVAAELVELVVPALKA